jgi:hypothetical protein
LSPSRGLKDLPSFCTARESVGVCNLRVESMYGGVYLKFGKLGYVFETLFKERDAARGVDMKVFEKYMHNSRVDVLMCARVYVWLCYSVDVFDAWYREMQNYADEDFINVDDAHLVGGLCPPQTPRGAPSPCSPSPRRSDRLRLKRMLEQEEGATSAPLRPPPCPSAQIKNSPGTDSNTLSPSRGLKDLPSFCTARESVGVCNLRVESMYGGVYLKFGKLGYVFETLFKERDAARGVDMKVFEKYMHNSRVDVLMCARVYVWLCYSVDVFDAWYREMQNYADEDFINVDDSHLVGGGGDSGVEAPLIDRNSNLESSASPSASPRRSDRLRLKRMLVQEQGSVLAY